MTITLSVEEYNRLKISEARMDQLEANGVDNWIGYGCMCKENGEDKCIFCTDNDLEFLGLEERKNDL